MKDLIKKVDKLGDVVERLQSLQSGSGGGGGVTTATLPLAITGSNIAIATTTTNDGGAIVKQASSPGTQQTGNINISGKLTAGSANLSGNITAGSVSTSSLTSSTISTTSSITGNTFIQAGTTIQAITGPYYLGNVPILDSGGTFPTTSLVDGERYWHTTYRSWFVYNSTDTKWRQEGPGVFASSFPTVAVGDNTVAPQIQATRLDRSLTYYWDGTRWLSSKIWLAGISRATQPVPQANTFMDFGLMDDFDTGNGLYVTALAIGLQFNTAQSTTNFYTITMLYTSDGTNYTIVTPTANGDTKTLTSASVAYRVKPTLTAFVLPNTARNFALRFVPTAAPGTFFLSSSLTCQLIG